MPAAGFGFCCLTVVAFCCCLPMVLAFSCCLPAALAFPCILIGLFALPLCEAALTFFVAAKKVSKESGLTPPASRCPPHQSTRMGPRRDLPSHPTRSWHSSHSSASRCALPRWGTAIGLRHDQVATRGARRPLRTRPTTHVVRSGMNDCCAMDVGNARDDLVFGPLRFRGRGGHLLAGGVSRFLCLLSLRPQRK